MLELSALMLDISNAVKSSGHDDHEVVAPLRDHCEDVRVRKFSKLAHLIKDDSEADSQGCDRLIPDTTNNPIERPGTSNLLTRQKACAGEALAVLVGRYAEGNHGTLREYVWWKQWKRRWASLAQVALAWEGEAREHDWRLASAARRTRRSALNNAQCSTIGWG